MFNTLNGRLNAIGLLPQPDGDFDQADRQHFIMFRSPLVSALTPMPTFDNEDLILFDKSITFSLRAVT